MDAVDRATLVAGQGIAGNANQGGRRQVTILSREAWDRVEESIGYTVDPTTRRANVLVSGIDLADTRDRVLTLGPCRVRIRGETRPCTLMDATEAGLRDAMDPEWRGGAFGEVLVGGELTVGDEVSWVDSGS
jgi:MOSC domain-containing protein YiiM